METFSALLALCAGIHRSPVNSPHKGQWRGALMFSFICAWLNGWVINREAGDLRRHRAHYGVIVMLKDIFPDDIWIKRIYKTKQLDRKKIKSVCVVLFVDIFDVNFCFGQQNGTVSFMIFIQIKRKCHGMPLIVELFEYDAETF